MIKSKKTVIFFRTLRVGFQSGIMNRRRRRETFDLRADVWTLFTVKAISRSSGTQIFAGSY